MKTQYYTASSLDGFIATEDDSLDWLFPLADIDSSSYPAFIAEIGAIAMGSSTYEWILKHSEEDIRFVSGDVRLIHSEMRAAAGSKNIWIAGGGDLAGQFYDAGRLDELIIQIGSVTLGKGKPVFPREVVGPKLRLVSSTPMGPGMIELRYELIGSDPN
jgi:dihydrofolate reductase